MAKKNNRVQPAAKKQDANRSGTRMWGIVSMIALVVSFGLIANLVLSQSPDRPGKPAKPAIAGQPSAPDGIQGDARLKLVASKFRCACGGCGELPLEECTCDMPRGAVEEKAFIQSQLSKGLTIDQIIEAVDRKYGHKES